VGKNVVKLTDKALTLLDNKVNEVKELIELFKNKDFIKYFNFMSNLKEKKINYQDEDPL